MKIGGSGSTLRTRRVSIAKNQNTFAKRKREMDKKAKAEAKRLRRIKRKQRDEESDVTAPQEGDANPVDTETEGPNV